MAYVVALVAIVLATSIASARLLRIVFEDLDLLAYLGLFVTCWIGAGGALVPVPGVRPMSWLMIVQQGGVLDPVVVVFVATSAMMIGQSSYFVTARAAIRRRPVAEPPADEAVVDAQPSEAGYRQRAQARVQRMVRQHGMAAVLLVTALPSPFTGITTAAAAVEEMSYPRFAVAATAGYLILCTVLALLGEGLFAGLRSLLPR